MHTELVAQCERCFQEFTFRWRGGRRHYCDHCRNEIKEKRRKAERKRWRKMPGGKACQKRHHKRRKAVGKSKGNRKAQVGRAVKEMRNSYIKTLISNETGISPCLITESLVNLKREQIYILRLYRKAKKELAL